MATSQRPDDLPLSHSEDDHPHPESMSPNTHRLRHRNTEAYISHLNSPETNRKNAGHLIRRMSDDFNTRKFPELIKQQEERRSQSLSAVEGTQSNNASGWTRRLSGAVSSVMNFRSSSQARGIDNNRVTEQTPEELNNDHDETESTFS